MKQSIILWLAAIIITFMSGYFQSVYSPDYPINGTVELPTGNVSFSFDRLHNGADGYRVWVAGDYSNIKGTLEWKDLDSANAEWNEVPLTSKGKGSYADIPPHKPLSKVEYRAKVEDKGNTYFLPVRTNVIMRFLEKVPPEISFYCFFFLFGGLLLSTRAGLEIFKEKPRLKLYTIFTLIFFFCYTFVFNTVKKSVEYGGIGTKALAPSELFTSGSVLLFAVWLLAFILVFATKKPKPWVISAAVITLIIFQAAKF
jgi:hypothetical protein